MATNTPCMYVALQHWPGRDDTMTANYLMYVLDVIDQRTTISPLRIIQNCPAASPKQQHQPHQVSQEPMDEYLQKSFEQFY